MFKSTLLKQRKLFKEKEEQYLLKIKDQKDIISRLTQLVINQSSQVSKK